MGSAGFSDARNTVVSLGKRWAGEHHGPQHQRYEYPWLRGARLQVTRSRLGNKIDVIPLAGHCKLQYVYT